jgi:hypothetical protein
VVKQLDTEESLHVAFVVEVPADTKAFGAPIDFQQQHNMGRKAGPRLRVDARKFAEGDGFTTNCKREMVELLTCLGAENFDEKPGQCAQEYAAMAQCSRALRSIAAARKGHMPSINYHLSRIARMIK